MGAVRFQVIGKVDGVPRVVARAHHPHRPRARCPSGRSRRRVDGCYRIKITGEPMMKRRLHPPRRARRPQRLRDDHHRPADRQRAAGRRRRRAGPGHARSTCRWSPAAGWCANVSILDRFADHRPGRDRHRRRPRARRRHRRRARRGGRRRPHLRAHRGAARRGRRAGSGRRAAGRVVVPADLSDLDAVAGPGADGVRRVRPARHRRQQRRRHLPARRSSRPARGSSPRRSASTSPPRTRSPGPPCR